MNETPDADDRPPTDLARQLATLRRRVDELERDREVLRCRRLVVVDESGIERIALETTASSASVRVLTDRAAGRSTAAELFAVDAREGDPPTVGVALTRDGDVVALVELGADGRARWWRADDDGADWDA